MLKLHMWLMYFCWLVLSSSLRNVLMVFWEWGWGCPVISGLWPLEVLPGEFWAETPPLLLTILSWTKVRTMWSCWKFTEIFTWKQLFPFGASALYILPRNPIFSPDYEVDLGICLSPRKDHLVSQRTRPFSVTSYTAMPQKVIPRCKLAHKPCSPPPMQEKQFFCFPLNFRFIEV